MSKPGLIFLGFDEAGLREAQADRDRHAEQLARKIGIPDQVAKEALACDRVWPTPATE